MSDKPPKTVYKILATPERVEAYRTLLALAVAAALLGGVVFALHYIELLRR